MRHVALHELAHVEASEGRFVVEEEFGERLRELRLSDAARAQEQKRTDRLLGIAETDASATNRARERAHALRLTDDSLLESFLHAKELVGFSFEHLRNRNARPATEGRGDVFLAENARFHARARAHGGALGLSDALDETRNRHVLEFARARDVLLGASVL